MLHEVCFACLSDIARPIALEPFVGHARPFLAARGACASHLALVHVDSATARARAPVMLGQTVYVLLRRDDSGEAVPMKGVVVEERRADTVTIACPP